MKTSNYPWDDIDSPKAKGEYSARLVSSAENPRGRRIFWAKSWDGNPSLLVEYKYDVWKQIALPGFKYIRVSDHRFESALVIELLDLDMRDIFMKVCVDIIAALQDVPEKACRKACILRLERWSSFLRPARLRLSEEAQKGLIAELQFLKNDALAAHDESAAICGWTGPESGPRDFSYGQVSIEVKSKRGSSNTNITVSSEHQLSTNETERLFLYVVEINNAPVDDDDAFSLTDVVEDVRLGIESPLQLATFDNKLASVGYFEEDDYSDIKWSRGSTYYYSVIDGFPKIDSKECPSGVEKVSYQIDLDYCDEYLVDRQTVVEAME